MLKRRIPIVLSALLIVLLSCSRSTQIANAEEEIKDNFRPGTALVECKVLELNPDLIIKVERSLKDLCAEENGVFICEDRKCEKCSSTPIPVAKGEKLPASAFSGSGNQVCEEAFVQYVNSPACFQYTTGGRTYYIPPG
jgi:hypothetical protein